MLTRTSPLSQQDSQQFPVNKNNVNGGMSLRSMLPTLLINAAVPFLINMLARPYMSTINALLLASAVPALFTLGNLIWKKHIDVLGLLVVVGLLLTAVFALLFNSPRLLLLQGSIVNGVFSVVMLISLLFPRPVMFYLVRSIWAQNDPQRLASFNADWSFPQFRSFYWILTTVWGCVHLAQVTLLAFLVFTFPISLMLVLAPILNYSVLILIVHWSIHYFRKNKPVFVQLRQQREAATSQIAS